MTKTMFAKALKIIIHIASEMPHSYLNSAIIIANTRFTLDDAKKEKLKLQGSKQEVLWVPEVMLFRIVVNRAKVLLSSV